MDILNELISERAWFWLLWAGLFGACIGSFLNVVIYRLPRGMSLSKPGSHCPRCQKPIHWYHNVPVFGWLWLRGRCAACRSAISPRYPLVEFAIALAWLGLAYVDVVVPQQEFPQTQVAAVVQPAVPPAAQQIPLAKPPADFPAIAENPDLLRNLARWFLHGVFASGFLAILLIGTDGQSSPAGLNMLTLGSGAAGLALFRGIPGIANAVAMIALVALLSWPRSTKDDSAPPTEP